jgi:predicted permease
MTVAKTAGSAAVVTVAILATLALIAGIVYGGWRLHWWFANGNAQQQTHLIRHNIGTQTSYEAAVLGDMQQIASIDVQLADSTYSAAFKSGLRGERIAIVNQACQVVGYIDAPTPPVSQFASLNCN